MKDKARELQLLSELRAKENKIIDLEREVEEWKRMYYEVSSLYQTLAANLDQEKDNEI